MSGEGISILISGIIVVAVLIGLLWSRFDSSGRCYRKVLEWTGDKQFANLTITHYSFQTHSVNVFALIDGDVCKYVSLQTFIDNYASVIKNKDEPRFIPIYWFIQIKIGAAVYLFTCAGPEKRHCFNWNGTEHSVDCDSAVEIRDRNLDGKSILIHGSETARYKKALFIVSEYNDMTDFMSRYTLDGIIKKFPDGKTTEGLDPVAQSMFAVVNKACDGNPIQVYAVD